MKMRDYFSFFFSENECIINHYTSRREGDFQKPSGAMSILGPSMAPFLPSIMFRSHKGGSEGFQRLVGDILSPSMVSFLPAIIFSSCAAYFILRMHIQFYIISFFMLIFYYSLYLDILCIFLELPRHMVRKKSAAAFIAFKEAVKFRSFLSGFSHLNQIGCWYLKD